MRSHFTSFTTVPLFELLHTLGRYRSARVYCEDCGKQTGSRQIPQMREGVQWVICRVCSFRRRLNFGRNYADQYSKSI